MRRIVVLLLAVLLAGPALPARQNGSWDGVKGLSAGAQVKIFLWNGWAVRGEILSVDDAEVRVAGYDPTDGQPNKVHEIGRRSVRRIVKYKEMKPLNRDKWLVVGAISGGAVGGAVAERQTKNSWPLGGIAGGFAGTTVAFVVTGLVDAARVHHGMKSGKVVYEVTGPRPD